MSKITNEDRLARLLDTPLLARVVPHLPPETVHQLIQELQGMAQDTEKFDAKFQELIHNVEHHVEEEESEMFPLAEQALAEDLEELSEEMQELKADLQGS